MQRFFRQKAVMSVCMGMFILMFSACAMIGQNDPPRVTLSSVKIQDINLFEAVLHIEMRVVNPQNVSYDIKGIDCVLDLDHIKLASGVSNTPTRIPSLKSSVIPLTVYSSVEDIAKCIKSLKGKNTVNYNIKGKLYLDGGFFKPSMIAFNTDGQVSLKEFMDYKF